MLLLLPTKLTDNDFFRGKQSKHYKNIKNNKIKNYTYPISNNTSSFGKNKYVVLMLLVATVDVIIKSHNVV